MTTTRHGGSRRALPFTVTAPAPREIWRELVADDPQALPTQSPEWVDCVCSQGRYIDASRLYQIADGRRALLPMVRRAHGSEGTATQHSLPAGWGFGGLVTDDAITADLVGSVVDDLVGLQSLRVHVRPNPLHAEAWAAGMAGRPGVTVISARAHVLDLTGGFEEVWRRRFRSSTRRQVRQAERRGVEVETDTTGRLVPEFYGLLRRSTDRWARHQHEPAWLAQLRRERRDPLEKFETMAGSLGEACRLSVARYDGRLVAAILVLRGRNAHYTRGVMDEALAGQTQANKLLHKQAIEDACRSGCSRYHMGESGESDGLSQFKSGFGAVPHRYAEYWIERLPLTRADQWLRRGVKRAIGFRDV